MAYSETLAGRIREALSPGRKVTEKKMFGGLAFMVDDKMCITVGPGRIMCRVNPEMHDELVKKEGCETVHMGGRAYKGYIHVSEDQLQSKKDLDHWIDLALEFNRIAKRSK